MEDGMDGILYGLFTIGGPVLLAAVLIYVMMSNRRHRTPEEIARTEAATRELHRQLDAEDKYLNGEGPPPRKK
jgi:hypothetical protein